METSLHQALKLRYGLKPERCERRLGKYRIDAMGTDGRLIEIQHGPLGAIRHKIRDLLRSHDVTIVKPLIVNKVLVTRSRQGGDVLKRRRSPKQQTVVDLFQELVHFIDVFPHERLALEILLVEVEEWRYPGHGRRRRWRENDYVVEDQRLVSVRETIQLSSRADLRNLLPKKLPSPFHTGQLATAMDVPRWVSQQIAYCLRHMKIAREVGKERNTRLYQWVEAESKPRRKLRVA
jgi:hypothetical protein